LIEVEVKLWKVEEKDEATILKDNGESSIPGRTRLRDFPNSRWCRRQKI
jgi:hypothetical protein